MTKMQENILKCLVIGDGGVGKTSMIIKHSTGEFPTNYTPCVYDGAYSPTPYEIDDVSIQLSIWDTGGGEDYERLRPLSYPMTDVFIICFSVVNPASFQRVRSHYAPEVAHYNPDTPVLVVGTKTDLRDDFSESSVGMRVRPICDYEGLSLVEEINVAAYKECSALAGSGVTDVFEEAMRLALKNSGTEGDRNRGRTDRCLVA